MLIRHIQPENYKYFPIRLKKYFQSNIGYKSYSDFALNTNNSVIGNLPPEIIKLFPKENKELFIKEFYKVLAQTSRQIRSSFNKALLHKNLNNNYRTPQQSTDLIEFNKEITQIFNDFLKNSKIGEIIKTDLQYVDFGGFGSVYKLSLKDTEGKKICHDKALKIYYGLVGNKTLQNRGHGIYAETNFWTFLKHAAGHNLGKTQFTKHYISDIKSGYALTEFADADIQKTTSSLNISKVLGLRCIDKYNNLSIYGKNFDGGGYIKNTKELVEDKMVRRYFKKLFYRNSPKDLIPVLEKLEAETQNPKNEHRTKIQKALELFYKTKYN